MAPGLSLSFPRGQDGGEVKCDEWKEKEEVAADRGVFLFGPRVAFSGLQMYGFG
jgi:hypothetical protein